MEWVCGLTGVSPPAVLPAHGPRRLPAARADRAGPGRPPSLVAVAVRRGRAPSSRRSTGGRARLGRRRPHRFRAALRGAARGHHEAHRRRGGETAQEGRHLHDVSVRPYLPSPASRVVPSSGECAPRLRAHVPVRRAERAACLRAHLAAPRALTPGRTSADEVRPGSRRPNPADSVPARNQPKRAPSRYSAATDAPSVRGRSGGAGLASTASR